jgi:4-amino-4-deoxy-L-arabinose transferase-like glycosyltransferase
MTTPSQPKILKSNGFDLWVIGLLSALLFLAALGARDLWNPNEPIYGRAVVEMWERGDWLLPTVNNAVFAEKPILYYWLALAASKAFGGVSEFTLRLPSSLVGVGAVLMAYLLVLPYAGRDRARLAAMLLATQYIVWWTARSVQMDVLVMVSSLGVLLPLSRMLDFEMDQTKAWALAGVAAGLGFAAKGPVTWIVPGIAFFTYVAIRRIPPRRWAKGLIWGGIVALALAIPWYLLLWTNGHQDAVREVLLRQNFSRFIEAWDHDKPWHYYSLYVVVDYLPWSWFVPVAFAIRGRTSNERRLDLLAWIWLGGTLLFFSLADSKRAPYILPIAPAVAVLASSAMHRLSDGRLSDGRRRACKVIAGGLASLFILGGVAILISLDRVPDLSRSASITAVAAMLSGLMIILALLAFRRRPPLLPLAIAAAMTTLYLTASYSVLPAANRIKSARPWAKRLAEFVAPDDTLVSYGFRRWRAGYPYYARRPIQNYLTKEELQHFWETERGYLLVEEEAVDEVREVLGEIPLVFEHHFSRRIAYVFTNISKEVS